MLQHIAPSVFVNHGGGPLPLLGDANHAALIRFLKNDVASLIKDSAPQAIVVISAHWEHERAVVISSSQQPSMIFDYQGFPKDAYDINYPAKGGNAELIGSIKNALEGASLGIPVKTEERGFDHGVFVPLMLAAPGASIPIVCLSLCSNRGYFDAELHFRIGEALAHLRNQGVMILGSGQTYHSMASFFNPSQESIKVKDLVSKGPKARFLSVNFIVLGEFGF